MTEILKPCPFCGGNADLRGDSKRGFYIGCDGGINADCILSLGGIFYETEAEAIKAWNRRANEYDRLVLAEKTCHTVEIREKATGKEGVVNTCENGVQVFYGAVDGSDDKTISPETFSRDFEITAEIASTGASMKPEDYAIEYCPYCEREVAIRSQGVTACPSCGKPLVPCSTCTDGTKAIHDCSKCPHGCITCSSEDEFIPITNPSMTEDEIIFAWVNS